MLEDTTDLVHWLVSIQKMMLVSEVASQTSLIIRGEGHGHKVLQSDIKTLGGQLNG